jgi:hypothetical protein
VIGVSKATVWDWVHGKYLPSLGQVFHTSEALNLTMEEVLTGRGTVNLFARRDRVQREKEAETPLRPTWLGGELRQVLEVLSKALPPMSLAEVARVIQISPRELYRRERDLSREISMRAIAARTEKAVEARAKRAQSIRVLRAQLAEEGLCTSRRRIEERMGASRVFILNGDFRRELIGNDEDPPLLA